MSQMPEKESLGDLFIPSKEALERAVISPRVILRDPRGNFILVLHQETGWWGLPGGKNKLVDLSGEENSLSTGAFPTLQREVSEEVGIDISPYLLASSGCLGLTEIFSVNSDISRITHVLSPIFVCMVPDLSGARQNTTPLTSTPFPGPLFPDARIALKYFVEKMKTKAEGPIIPEFLNKDEVFYFQMKPTPRLLIGPPPWA